MDFHKPVLLKEVKSFLDPKPGDLIIDATVGGGGHTREFLRAGARVLAIDRDLEAIEALFKEFGDNSNLILIRGNFNSIKQIAQENGFSGVKGILMDLGVSSNQLAKSERGFSFLKEGPLDMRMDRTLGVSAYDIVNNFEERRLHEIFETFGQEKFSRAIAHAICSARQMKPIKTTTELAAIIKGVGDRGVRKSHYRLGTLKIHRATKTFQALRIVVNSELLNLEEALPQTVDLLEPKGRLAVISFHSLEDGIVKRFFKYEERFMVLTKKPVGPQPEEVNSNPRSRSARLRVAQRINS